MNAPLKQWLVYLCNINPTTVGNPVKNFLFCFLSTNRIASSYSNTQTFLHTTLHIESENRVGFFFLLCCWEMERTLWFCCSAALFSSPHLFKAVRQQSGTINLNRSALPAPLWLDVMISGCHSAHWYVSPRDPSASLFCHEQPGVYRGHAGGFLPRSVHSTQPPQSCVIIIPRVCLLCLLVASVTYGYHLHTVYGAIWVYFYEKVCLWKSILWITDESYNLLTFDRKKHPAGSCPPCWEGRVW